MLSIAVFVCLVAGAFSAPPSFSYRPGSCPNVDSSDDFTPSMLYNHNWKMMFHTDPIQNHAGCCNCVTVKYNRVSDTVFTSEREGTTTSSQQMTFWSRLSKIADDSSNRYSFEYKDADQWHPTNMKTSFYFLPDNNNYFMAYGCMEREQNDQSEFADVALLMTKDSNYSADKMDGLKTYLRDKRGSQPHYYSISQADCA